jgi:SAM-dependent methyltransferase
VVRSPRYRQSFTFAFGERLREIIPALNNAAAMSLVWTIPANLFEEHYRADPGGDPFHYIGNRFELSKYHVQVALLADKRYARALEIGCSIGVFSQMAGPLSDDYLGIDCSEAAIESAAERCRDQENVRFQCRHVPLDFPSGPFDAVTMAEVGYYLDGTDLIVLRDAIARETVAGARILLTHMTLDFDAYMGRPLPSKFADIHGGFETDDRFRHLTRLRGHDIAGDPDFSHQELYICDLFERSDR